MSQTYELVSVRNQFNELLYWTIVNELTGKVVWSGDAGEMAKIFEAGDALSYSDMNKLAMQFQWSFGATL